MNQGKTQCCALFVIFKATFTETALKTKFVDRFFLAWFPSEIFPKYGDAVELQKTIANRFQRATKRGKFSRAAWEFDVVLNSRQ